MDMMWQWLCVQTEDEIGYAPQYRGRGELFKREVRVSALGQACPFIFKQKTAYEISACLVGSGMCIRDRYTPPPGLSFCFYTFCIPWFLNSHDAADDPPRVDPGGCRLMTLQTTNYVYIVVSLSSITLTLPSISSLSPPLCTNSLT